MRQHLGLVNGICRSETTSNYTSLMTCNGTSMMIFEGQDPLVCGNVDNGDNVVTMVTMLAFARHGTKVQVLRETKASTFESIASFHAGTCGDSTCDRGIDSEAIKKAKT